MQKGRLLLRKSINFKLDYLNLAFTVLAVEVYILTIITLLDTAILQN